MIGQATVSKTAYDEIARLRSHRKLTDEHQLEMLDRILEINRIETESANRKMAEWLERFNQQVDRME